MAMKTIARDYTDLLKILISVKSVVAFSLSWLLVEATTTKRGKIGIDDFVQEMTVAVYTLPRDVFDLLLEAFGEKDKAETFAKAIERSIQAIEERADEALVEKKSLLKVELREELRQELVTRELFEERFKRLETEMAERFNVVDERFNVVDEKFKSLNFKLNIFIAIALLALTLANPTFVALVERLFALP